MCDPVSLTVIVAATVAISTATAVEDQKAREAQKKLVKANANLQATQVRNKQGAQAEAAAQKEFNLTRAALTARGASKSTELGDRSVRAIGRAIGFELGSDKATVRRNQELAAETAAARLTGINLTEQSQLGQIGDTSGLRLGLEITGGVLSAVGQGIGSANTPSSDGATATTPDTAVGGPGQPNTANVA